MHGADAAELRRLAGQFRATADDIDSEGSIMTRVLGNVSWLGDVATRFTSDWSGIYLPKVGLSTQFLRNAADQLDRNANEQERASEPNGGGLGAGGGVAPFADEATRRTSELETVGSQRLDSMDSREAVLNREAKYIENSTLADRYPAAAAKAKAWLDELLAGDPSPGEVAAFEAYMGAVKFAAVQEVWIERAGQHAFEQFTEAAKAGAGAAASGFSLGGSALAQGDYGLGMSVFEEMLGGVGEYGAEAASNAVGSPTEMAAMGGRWAVAGYRADADAALAGLEKSFRDIDHVGHLEPLDLAVAWNDATGATVEQAVQQAELAESFTILTGDGSAADIALRTGLNVAGDLATAGMASKALDAAAVVGGGAKAGYHISSATMCLDVVGQGVDNIFNAYDVFARTPVTE